MDSIKILVVDDEAFVADLGRMALGESGYDVTCAFSGEKAIEKAMTEHFDLAIVDAMLPGMTGIETFDAIRQFLPTICGILVSGHASSEMIEEAKDVGFSRVLHKPMGSVELVNAVRDALSVVNSG